MAVRVGSQVKDGNLCFGVPLDDVFDDVAAQKAASTDNYNLS